MKLLRNLFDSAVKFIKRSPLLKRFYPTFDATDEFFFGPYTVSEITPYIRDGLDIKRYMSFVIVALIPATLAGIYFYGLRVLAVIAVSYVFGGLV